MPTLTVTVSGLNWTATVTGTGGGAVALFSAPSLAPPAAWTQVGTRTGDGTVAGAVLTAGGRWFLATAGGVPTNPAYALFTAGANALATRCRDAVLATVEALALPVTAVAEQPYLDGANRTGPWVSVSVDGLSERIAPGLNLTNDVDYPVRVSICDRHHLRDRAKLRERYEPWREEITAAFLGRRLAGVPESVQCDVDPRPVLDPLLPAYETVVSAVVVWCRTRANR